jgi:hypothetical protein
MLSAAALARDQRIGFSKTSPFEDITLNFVSFFSLEVSPEIILFFTFSIEVAFRRLHKYTMPLCLTVEKT